MFESCLSIGLEPQSLALGLSLETLSLESKPACFSWDFSY